MLDAAARTAQGRQAREQQQILQEDKVSASKYPRRALFSPV